jgi:hypothetical protein
MNQLRYRIWNSDDVHAGELVVDPLFVASVVETVRRRAYGGNNNVAVIRLSDGKEFTVCDDARRVALEIWQGKSISN